MNAVVHARLSVNRRGGKIEDYLPIHDFMDSTKELCSDNRHRILHTLWGVRRVVVPIFGHTMINSDGKPINVKDLCEQDHILPDYRNRFIPTLSDFSAAIDPKAIEEIDFEKFTVPYHHDSTIMELLLSPLNVTGMKASLLITHNAWFINEIIPKINGKRMVIQEFSIKPGDLFNNMNFKLWMDNGAALPPSCRLTATNIVE